MTDRATLLALADRVEAASGPDRALSADILKAVGYRASGWQLLDPNGNPCLQVPDVLASIDAALSLVPDGWRKMVDDLDRTPEAIVSTPDQKRSWDGRAATMPLALTAAALRALAQEAPSDG